ncbi:MAG: hypothetical protein OEM23_06520, partial [Gemmatimonadota bacterium]|nr:hypothetical protein [Gemmatimonadota bacterium]
MRIAIGTDDGLRVIRWLAGERSGTVTSRAFDGHSVVSLTSHSGVIYAAVPDSGVHKTSDRGATWQPAAALPSGVHAETLAVSPSGDLLVGTEPAQLLRSTDAGASWIDLAGFGALRETETWSEYGGRAAHVEAVAFDRHDAARLYAGVEIGGAYRSDDHGQTWNGVNDGLYDDIHDLVVDPRDGSRLFAATGGGLYVSRDRGADWRPMAGPVGSLYATRLLAIAGSRAAAPSQTLLLLGTADGPPSTWGRAGQKGGGKSWISSDSGS